MSNYKHRQPVWGWSSVVLLSTLLLSPMAAASLLGVLAHALPQAARNAVAAAPADPTAPATPAANTTPRRAADEEETLRRAAARPFRAYRLDTDPTGGIATLIALLVPTRTLERVPDTVIAAPAGTRFGPDADAALPSRAFLALPSRAPPA